MYVCFWPVTSRIWGVTPFLSLGGQEHLTVFFVCLENNIRLQLLNLPLHRAGPPPTVAGVCLNLKTTQNLQKHPLDPPEQECNLGYTQIKSH